MSKRGSLLGRLEWLAQWVVPHADAIAATRPWVRPGTATAEGAPVRYTARDETVYAFVRDPKATVTLPDVRTPPTTAVTTVDGAALAWRETEKGLAIELPAGAGGPEPTVISLRNVAARPT